MNITNGGSFSKKIAFTGLNQTVDDSGFVKQKFYYPFDSDKYEVRLEIFDADKAHSGEYKVDESNRLEELKLDPKSNSVDIDGDDYFDPSKKQYAYRFAIYPKKDGRVEESQKPMYAFDPGHVVGMDGADDQRFNIAFLNRATLSKAGKMQLIMPDEFYPGVVKNADGSLKVDTALRATALTKVRNHATKLGGKLDGIIYKLPELEKEGYTRIVGMPLTKDTVSSHLYWTQNAFQMAPQLGSMDDMKNFQKELFKHDMNWISDAALVNEGLQGMHFSSVLKWGDKSPYYNWFKAPGAANNSLTLGVLPKDMDHVKMKLVNAPFNLDKSASDKDNYDPSRPTYVQFYDDRLASASQVRSNKVFTSYENATPENRYGISSHDDVVDPYAFEINPETFKTNLKRYVKEKGEGADFNSVEAIEQLTNNGHFKVSTREQSSGFETWDGNTDIAKLNFYIGNADMDMFKNLPADEKQAAIEKFEHGVVNVQDYAVNSGKYWTKFAADTQIGYAASVFSDTEPTVEAYSRKIDEAVAKGQLPKSAKKAMTPEVIQNILDNNYVLPRADVSGPLKDVSQKTMYDYPLETLPVSEDTLAVLASPYIATRANTKDDIGKSRYEIHQAGDVGLPSEFKDVHKKANAFFDDNMSSFVNDIVDIMPVDDLETARGNVTQKGAYVVDQIMPEVLQYAFIKSLDPNAEIKFNKDGSLNLSDVKTEDTSLAHLQIAGVSPDDEAAQLVNKLKSGLSSISAEDKQELGRQLAKRFRNVDANALKMADALVDRTESGMGWRIDAAKDVASIDSVRNGSDSFSNAWENVIKFWKTYNESVLSVNPHAYTTAEITDVAELMNIPGGQNGRFKDQVDAERKFIEETGITTTANYSYFYSMVPQLFNKSAEDGSGSGLDKVNLIKDKLINAWEGNPGFLYATPLDGVVHSYTFVGNHDKPRLLHTLALDMGLFYSDFSGETDRTSADKVLGSAHKPGNSASDYEDVSPMAVAMGSRLKDVLIDKDSVVTDPDQQKAVSEAISNLATGKFLDKKDFHPDMFGARPIDMAINDVLEEAVHISPDAFPKDAQKRANLLNKISNESYNRIMEPAFDKYASIYKTLVALPGDATDFAGDKVATTGYETKAKNYFQQNRNNINWEWLDEKDTKHRKLVKGFYDDMNNILDLRNKEGLSALNDGVPVSLNSNNDKLYPLLRYNDKGSVVLSLFNTSGATDDVSSSMNRKDVTADYIKLGKGNAKEGLGAGIKEGTIFKNARESDMNEYRVVKGADGYVLKAFSKIQGDVPITVKPEDKNVMILYKVK